MVDIWPFQMSFCNFRIALLHYFIDWMLNGKLFSIFGVKIQTFFFRPGYNGRPISPANPKLLLDLPPGIPPHPFDGAKQKK